MTPQAASHADPEDRPTPSRSDWVAVDAATIPAKLARELRDAWEGFVDGHTLDRSEDEGTPPIRNPIAASWRRSRDAGVDPHGRQNAPSLMELTGARASWDGAPAGDRRAADRRVHVGRRGRRRPPDGHQRRLRHAAQHPRRRHAAQPRRRRDELRRGRAVERGRRRDQRRRHRAGRRARGPGLRRRALHRARAALDLRGRADQRPGHREAARRHRPHRRHEQRPPAQPLGRRRDRARRRAAPAHRSCARPTSSCAPATPRSSARAPAPRWSPRPGA